MVYYKAIECCGNFPKIYSIAKNEIFTKKEIEKYNIPTKILVPVEISKRRVYFFFGARFEAGTFFESESI